MKTTLNTKILLAALVGSFALTSCNSEFSLEVEENQRLKKKVVTLEGELSDSYTFQEDQHNLLTEVKKENMQLVKDMNAQDSALNVLYAELKIARKYTFTIPGEYPGGSTHYLNDWDLEDMSKSDLRLMRNEIFARHGLIFAGEGTLARHFNSQDWYRGTRDDVYEYLTDIEKQNIKLIKDFEDYLEESGEEFLYFGR